MLVFPLMYTSFLLHCFSFPADHGSFLFVSLPGTSTLGGSKYQIISTDAREQDDLLQKGIKHLGAETKGTVV